MSTPTRDEHMRIDAALSFLYGRTASDLATASGVSLKTVHRVLADLVERGSVETRGEGRTTLYRIDNAAAWQPAPAVVPYVAPKTKTVNASLFSGDDSEDA